MDANELAAGVQEANKREVWVKLWCGVDCVCDLLANPDPAAVEWVRAFDLAQREASEAAAELGLPYVPEHLARTGFGPAAVRLITCMYDANGFLEAPDGKHSRDVDGHYVARGYLRLLGESVRPDDAEPVTGGWLEGLADGRHDFTFRGPEHHVLVYQSNRRDFPAAGPERWCACIDGAPYSTSVHLKRRGMFRKLLDALEVPQPKGM